MPNNDGIDIDWSSNVRIRGCHIATGDDCISLKTAPLSEGITRPCENVVISGCTLRSRSCGIVIGLRRRRPDPRRRRQRLRDQGQPPRASRCA